MTSSVNPKEVLQQECSAKPDAATSTTEPMTNIDALQNGTDIEFLPDSFQKQWYRIIQFELKYNSAMYSESRHEAFRAFWAINSELRSHRPGTLNMAKWKQFAELKYQEKLLKVWEGTSGAPKVPGGKKRPRTPTLYPTTSEETGDGDGDSEDGEGVGGGSSGPGICQPVGPEYVAADPGSRVLGTITRRMSDEGYFTGSSSVSGHSRSGSSQLIQQADPTPWPAPDPFGYHPESWHTYPLPSYEMAMVLDLPPKIASPFFNFSTPPSTYPPPHPDPLFHPATLPPYTYMPLDQDLELSPPSLNPTTPLSLKKPTPPDRYFTSHPPPLPPLPPDIRNPFPTAFATMRSKNPRELHALFRSKKVDLISAQTGKMCAKAVSVRLLDFFCGTNHIRERISWNKDAANKLAIGGEGSGSHDIGEGIKSIMTYLQDACLLYRESEGVEFPVEILGEFRPRLGIWAGMSTMRACRVLNLLGDAWRVERALVEQVAKLPIGVAMVKAVVGFYGPFGFDKKTNSQDSRVGDAVVWAVIKTMVVGVKGPTEKHRANAHALREMLQEEKMQPVRELVDEWEKHKYADLWPFLDARREEREKEEKEKEKEKWEKEERQKEMRTMEEREKGVRAMEEYKWAIMKAFRPHRDSEMEAAWSEEGLWEKQQAEQRRWEGQSWGQGALGEEQMGRDELGRGSFLHENELSRDIREALQSV